MRRGRPVPPTPRQPQGPARSGRVCASALRKPRTRGERDALVQHRGEAVHKGHARDGGVEQVGAHVDDGAHEHAAWRARACWARARVVRGCVLSWRVGWRWVVQRADPPPLCAARGRRAAARGGARRRAMRTRGAALDRQLAGARVLALQWQVAARGGGCAPAPRRAAARLPTAGERCRGRGNRAGARFAGRPWGLKGMLPR